MISPLVPQTQAGTVKVGISSKKRLGRYYTPASLTSILCSWAIRKPNDLVLEPSFGGCGFLESAAERLCYLGSDCPSRQLFGADIDEAAFKVLSSLPGRHGHERNFFKKDFLTLSRIDFGQAEGFDVVIGNPPYVSHHNMAAAQKMAAWAKETSERRIDRRSSLWAYFVVHSLSFLRAGGRLALILPTSFLYADYGKAIQELLAKNFLTSVALHLVERMFEAEGTSEAAVVVLCDGYLKGCQERIAVRTVGSLGTLDDALKGAHFSEPSPQATSAEPLDPAITELKTESEDRGKCKIRCLDDLFEIRIGLVSGANRFFVLSQRELESKGIGERHLTPLAVKLSSAKGLSLTRSRFREISTSGERCHLLDSERSPLTPEISDYLATYPADEKAMNVTFRKREPWHKVNDGIVPDAFLGYMAHTVPRLVLNRALANCTNNLHRLSLKEACRPADLARIALASWSTLYQYSAEREGRPYGAGALKIEPSRARRLLLPLSCEDDRRVLEAYRKVCRALRGDDEASATRIADEFLFGGDPRIQQVRDGVKMLRASRFGGA